MKKQINLGKIKISAEDYAIAGNTILGIKDSGKSQTAKYVAESLMDSGIPIIAIDISGVWSWLRVGRKGNNGYPIVIAGGERRDFPITAKTAPEIIRAARKARISLVIDLHDRSISRKDRNQIVAAITEVLLFENKEWGLCHLFFEEAQSWVPQNIRGNDEDKGRAYSTIEEFCRIGGNSGVGYTLISPRAEGINKEVLELCDMLILGRQKGKNSLIALNKWLDVVEVENAAELKRDIPRLETGNFLIWPSQSDRPVKTLIPENKTVHPNRRQLIGGEKKYKPVDTKSFVVEMGKTLSTIVEESKVNDPSELKKQIAQLKRELAQKQAGHPQVKIEPQIIEKPVFKNGDLNQLEKILARLETIGSKEIRIAEQRQKFANAILANTVELTNAMKAVINQRPLPVVQLPRIQYRQQPERLRLSVAHEVRTAEQNGDASLVRGERDILQACGKCYPMRISMSQIGRLSARSVKSSSFQQYARNVIRKGFIDKDHVGHQLTDAGMTEINFVPSIPRGEHEIIEMWRNSLISGERDIFDFVFSQRGQWVEKIEISENTGKSIKSSSFEQYTRNLVRNKLFEKHGSAFRFDEQIIEAMF